MNKNIEETVSNNFSALASHFVLLRECKAPKEVLDGVENTLNSLWYLMATLKCSMTRDKQWVKFWKDELKTAPINTGKKGTLFGTLLSIIAGMMIIWSSGALLLAKIAISVIFGSLGMWHWGAMRQLDEYERN